LTAADDPQAFADAIQQILTDPLLRISLALKSGARGASLPTWHDTARVMRDALNA
jgi:hypothetical protein